MAELQQRQAAAPAFSFSGLTQQQRDLLDAGGWAPVTGCGKQPNRAMAQRLVDRGLLTKRDVRIGLATVTAYDVPSAVKEAWANLSNGKAQ